MTVRRLLRTVPAVAFVLFLVWASTPLWHVTSALPDRLARFVPAAQAVFAVGVLGALLCLIVVCWQAWRRRSAVPGVLAVLLTVAVVAPVGIVTAQSGAPDEGASEASGKTGESGERLRVMALNTYFNGADDASIIAETRRIDPDVLVLSETSSAEVDAVEGGTGLTSTSPVDDSGGASGTAVLVRPGTPVSDVVEDRGLAGHQTPSARVSVPGPVDVYGVHTLPPAFSDLISGWEENLATLRDSFEASDVPLVLAGDFNATVAHPEFRDLLDRTGLTRCEGSSGIQRLTGTPTWPDRFPLVRIDHVLVRDGSCEDGGTVQVEGTDHRGVWADIWLFGFRSA